MIEVWKLTRKSVPANAKTPNFNNVMVTKSLGHGAGSIDFSQKIAEFNDEDWQKIVNSGDEYAKTKLGNVDKFYEIEIFPERAVRLLQSLENSALGEFLKDLDEGYVTIRKAFR